ncbi:MAG: Fe-S cluster assembly protein SufD [Gemmataceae bacterium]
MTTATQEKSTYLADFDRHEKDLMRQGTPGIHRLRKAAIARFADLGFPKTRDEEWRFTNIAPLAAVPFELGRYEAEGQRDKYAHVDPDEAKGSLILCVNGYKPFVHHRGPALPEGVIITRLGEALITHPQLVEPHLGRYADYKSQPFTALNTAFLSDGAFIYVPKGQVIEYPITVLTMAAAFGRPIVWHRRCLVIAEANSQIRLVEKFVGLKENDYFTNAVTEIVVGAGAKVDHYKVQEEGNRAFHIATLQVQQDRGSQFASQNIALGGALVRNDINAVLGAEDCECTLNGLYVGSGQQLIDNHTFIDHAKPNCASHELYKGILSDKARGVFNGKILVRQDAQKTDAKQTNKTLLLSDDATINTKPQLEIYADDVKCTHGATVGQLDQEAIFYLRSRGIGDREARHLLTYAFANDIVGRIPIDPIRDQLERALLASQQLPEVQKVRSPKEVVV